MTANQKTTIEKIWNTLQRINTDYLLLFLSFFVIIFVVIFTFGKMPLGDSSISITDGMMIKAGLIPYRDIYIYTGPLTACLAALALFLSYPIHAINILLALNLVINFFILYLIALKLKVAFIDKIFAYLIFSSIQLPQVISFSHHAFNITITTAVVLLLVLHLIHQKVRYAYLAGLAAVVNLFFTQHIGLATVCLVPAVVFLQNYFKTKKFREFWRVLLVEIFLVIFAFLLLYISGVPIKKMLEITVVRGTSQYSTNYTSTWRNYYSLVSHSFGRFIAKDEQSDSPFQAEQTVVNKLYNTGSTSFFDKIFLKKSALLQSVGSLMICCYILLVFIFIAIRFIISILQRKIIKDPIVYLFIFSALILFLVLLTPFVLGFGIVSVIFLLGVYSVRNSGFFNQRLYVLILIPGILFLVLLSLSNFAVLKQEYDTREYFLAGNNENVWSSQFYFGPSFVSSVRQVREIVNQLAGSTEKIIIYPRASEFYYVFNRLPNTITSLVAFSHPKYVYDDIVKHAAENNRLVIIYSPPFDWSENPETLLAKSFMDPVLQKDYKIVFSNLYFTAYEHK